MNVNEFKNIAKCINNTSKTFKIVFISSLMSIKIKKTSLRKHIFRV